MATMGFRFGFENRNNQRSWTELFYITMFSGGIDTDQNRQMLRAIAISRCGALVTQNRLSTITAWDVDVPRVTSIREVNLPGTLFRPAPPEDARQDIAPASVLLQLNSPDANRFYLMRGIVDEDVVDGAFVPVGPRRGQYNNWFNQIVLQQLRIRASIFAPMGLIDTITDGTITLTAAAPVTGAGALLSIRTKVAGGGKPIVSRTRLLLDTTLGETALEINWPFGNCESGDVRRVLYTYSQITSYSQAEQVRTRKTGGPRSKFRGRR